MELSLLCGLSIRFHVRVPVEVEMVVLCVRGRRVLADAVERLALPMHDAHAQDDGLALTASSMKEAELLAFALSIYNC